MKNKKYYVLFFQYNSIHLFVEKDGVYKKTKFANGKESLSNCITFSYEKEDLEFLPDGDPFDVNNNSTFSDFLDFAGYHFEFQQGIIEIINYIEKNGLLPGIKSDDEIILLMQLSYYETNDTTESVESSDISEPGALKHKTTVFLMDFMYSLSIDYLLHKYKGNFLFGDQFFAAISSVYGDTIENIFLPTMEGTSVATVEAKRQLKTTLPKDLLRNIKNKIIIAKLFNSPIPKEYKYRNQRINVAHLPLAEMFEDVMKENANLISERVTHTDDRPTFIFDLGMHHAIKEAFLAKISNPIFISKEDSIDFVSYLINNLIIEFEHSKDAYFRMHNARAGKELRKDVDKLQYCRI